MERESSEEERRVISEYSSHKRWNCDWLEWVVIVVIVLLLIMECIGGGRVVID